MVVAELNLGQYRREIERLVAGRARVVGVHRVDGELISPQQIEEALRMTARPRGTAARDLPQRDAVPVLPGLRPRPDPRPSRRRRWCGCSSIPRKVVLVTDIGCSGLSDQYFATSAFHGLHGRSLTYATGIKLARPELEVIVVMGDGGTGIGGAHLLNAARRNIGLTLLVFNNFNFGMTGGQHSTTTPPGAVTSTTPGGNLERPLDICATVAVNGAAWAAARTSFDEDLAERIAEAIATPGFALLDIWELCTAYYVPSNAMSKKALHDLLGALALRDRRPPPRSRARVRRRLSRGARGGKAAPRGSSPRPIAPRFSARARAPLPSRHRRLGRRQGPLLGASRGAGRDSLGTLRRAARRLSDHGQDRPQHLRSWCSRPGRSTTPASNGPTRSSC